MSIEEINHRLETLPYFKLGLDYDMTIVLPDSVQEKFAKALNREIPEKVLDSLSALNPQSQYARQELRRFSQECGDDSLCIQCKYQELIKKEKEKKREQYANDVMPNILILTAANWQVKKAIPVLKSAIGDTKYDQLAVFMALAKLGNDSIKQVLMEKYTLDYILKNSQLDTINENTVIYNLEKKGWSTVEGIQTAIYLKSKAMLKNILDLIYIRGISGFCIDLDCFDYPEVSFFVDEYSGYSYFHNFPNYEVLRKICNEYGFAIRRLYNEKQNKNTQKKLETLLSTEYRTKIRNQLRDWINENVNFEE
jgi:hypothetical protein